ncbi:hypothetical protein H5410_026885 [Solanum commersonii]|uniref:Reverse transcriptase domain-containing protein n=1 Tax=Solanum commersonii TaxID=4109 RepID=A0A9J5YXR6_SOLCO|nr:hypothetical protein H5410_026885 [Solanum commersonii]
MVVDIRKRSKTTNALFKLDMAKAYDMVYWGHLMKFLGKMSFEKLFINKIWRLVTNNWYLFNVDKWTNLALNNLHSVPGFKGFGLSKCGEEINHLAYVDDTIIFASVDNFSLKACQEKESSFSDLVKKVQNNVQEWKGKLLSLGGKVVLINNVLQNVSIYQLAAIIPPKCVIHDLHKVFARFMWNFKEIGRNKHWVA